VFHTPVNTDDGNVCTTDGCDPATGVFHNPVPDGTPGQPDGNACTSDICFAGITVHQNINTDDGNACTTDGCNPATGVFHNPVNTDDGNACTTDGCDPATGVFHNPVNTNDNNACTTDGCDPATGVFHNPVNTNDGDPCTIDGCDPSTGVFHNPNPVNPTATQQGPIVCFGGTTCVNVTASGGSGTYSGTGTICNVHAGNNLTFTVTDNNGCSGTSAPITITQPTKVTGTTSSTPSGCSLNNGTASVTASGGAGGYTYLWSPGGQTTSTATGLAGGPYSVTITDASGCTDVENVTVGSAGSAPAVPGPISGPAGACKGQTGVVYSVPNTPGTTYIWSLPAGVTGSSSTNSITVNYSALYAGGFICVSAQNGCGTSSPACIPVPFLTFRPSYPGAITGPQNTTSVCGPTTVTYSIPVDPYATDYVWTVTGTGFTLASGQGTNTITVNAAAGFTFGTVNVYKHNCVGNSDGLTGYVYGAISAAPNFTVAPSVGLCGGGTYNFAVSSYAGASSFTWSAPAGAVITDASNNANFGNPISTTGTSVNVTFPNGFVSGNLTVFASNDCGSGAVRTLAVRSTPGQSAFISGPNTGVCGQSGVNYTASAVPGATSYHWTLPAGVTLVSASPDSITITVNFTASFTLAGNICVTPSGTCGLGSVSRCQNVTPRPASTGTISGPASVCKVTAPVQSYSVSATLGATFNTWTANNGAIITSGNNTLGPVSINFSGATSPVTITVRAFNACGAAALQSTLSVTVNNCKTSAAAVVSGDQFNAYPNPTSGKLTVSFNATSKEKYVLKVTDLIGKVMLSRANTAEEGVNLQEIDLSDIAKGMYLLSIEREGTETQTMRIVVE